jgi:hypothetical protein
MVHASHIGPGHVVVFTVLNVAVRDHGVIVVVRLVFGLPGHFVLLLEAPPGVGEPRGHLRQGHFGDDGQHDFLALGRVGVLFVLVEPRLQGGGALAGGVFAPRRQVVAGAVPGTQKSQSEMKFAKMNFEVAIFYTENVKRNINF